MTTGKGLGAPMAEWDAHEARETPTDEVTCLVHKGHMEEWPDDLRARELDTGEVICERCLKLLRELGRTKDRVDFEDLTPLPE